LTECVTNLTPMKDLFKVVAGGTALAGLGALVALAVLALFVIPGGLGILTIEFERARRWLRQVRTFLMRATPTPKKDITRI
jgi:hypothetical protein